jgi:PAS domain S-box-containing protein
MEPTLLEYDIGADGRYVDANPALLAATGYTLDELRGLMVGQLSTTSPDVAREMWQRLVRGEYEPRQTPVLVRRKDGRLFDAILLSVARDPKGDRWRVVLELVRLPDERPAREALAATLADWRPPSDSCWPSRTAIRCASSSRRRWLTCVTDIASCSPPPRPGPRPPGRPRCTRRPGILERQPFLLAGGIEPRDLHVPNSGTLSP